MLYIVATPIGNLSDLTDRAKAIFQKADFLLAEDTRRAGLLLDHLGIKKTILRFDEHSRETAIKKIVSRLRSESAALTTDAGTPNLSDPAWRLIKEAVLSGVEVSPIPGPAAPATLISVAHFPVARPLILGFLPKKKGRQTLLKELLKLAGQKIVDSLVIFESPYRIKKTLLELAEIFPENQAVLGRELTKEFEEIRRGKLLEIGRGLKEKGEISLLVSLR